MAFDPLFLIAALGGGLLGAAIGGLPIFIICGAAAIIGAGITAATGNANFSNLVAWGPLLGPQVSFAGGAAAAIYAVKRGKMTNGRDIGTALAGLDAPDVLLIGALFGALGYILQWLFSNLPAIGGIGFTNPIALSIICNAIIARLVFGKTGVFGKVRKGDNRWRASDVGAWIPWESNPLQLLVIGLGFGIVVSYMTKIFPAAGLWFGVAAFSLVFLEFNVKVPVWHHVALAAEQVMVVAAADMYWGIAFALLAVFLGEFYAMLFTAHGDSHIDPPSAALFTTFTIMAILKAVGAFNISGIGSLIIALAVAVIGYAIMMGLKAKPNTAQVAAKEPTA